MGADGCPTQVVVAQELVGQSRLVNRLALAISASRLPRSVLLSGPSGSGRKTVASRLAVGFAATGNYVQRFSDPVQSWPANEHNAVRLLEQGAHPDILMLQPTSEKGELTVSQVREIQNFARVTPSIGRGKVAIISDANALNRSSSNAILKVLEEPNSRLAILLVASNAHMLLPTIRSRCAQFVLEKLTSSQLASIVANSALRIDDRVLLLANGDAGLAIDLARIDFDPAELTEIVQYIFGPDARLLSKYGVKLAFWEKQLGTHDASRVLVQAIISSDFFKGQRKQLTPQRVDWYLRAAQRIKQRQILGLDSQSSWLDTLIDLKGFASG